METPNPEPTIPADVPAVSERDALISELEALGNEPEAVEVPAPDEGEESSANEDSEESTPEEVEEQPEEVEPTEDSETLEGVDQKKLAALQRQEKRFKEQTAQREREIQERETALAERETAMQERLSRFESLEKRASYDVAGVLEALGVDPEHFEQAARDLYSKRPGAKPDPTNRAAIQRRELQDELRQNREEIANLRKQIETDKQQADLERRANAYMDKAAGLVDSETPIVAKLLGNNPAKFREFLSFTANKLFQETGETPEHVDVIREMENIKSAELQELGIDLPSGNSQSSTQSQQKPAGRTLTNSLVTPTKPRTEPLSEAEERADVLKGMAELDI